MQDIAVPPLIPPTTHGTLADLPHDWAVREPGRALLSRSDGAGWRDVSAAEFDQQVRALAKGFLAAGIEIGDRVALLSRTRYEWTLTDFALWTVGAVPVPVYETSSASQVQWILRDCSAVAIVVESTDHMATLQQFRSELESLRDVWQIDGGGLDELVAAGVDITDAQLEQRRTAQDRDALATIIYTSGTTADPKGCELTHGNFLALAENAAERLEMVVGVPGARTLLFLPLAHVFARFIQVVVLHAGATLGHSPDVSRLLDDLGDYHPTFLLAVPRVFEKIYNAAEQKAEAGGRGRIFRAASRTAQQWSRSQESGGPGVLLRARHRLFDTLVYAKLRAAMGGQVQYAISGGAALGERLGHFFRGVGVTVLEGYGLTETTAPSNVNTPDLIKIGTVGRPLPGVSVRIADDGEILIRGVGVFSGYHDNAELTEQAFADGWLRTGDIGSMDADGFLRITGRLKEVLITAGGKNVSPAPLEDRVRAHPLVSQCVVVGEARPFVAALVSLDAEMLPIWAQNNDLGGITPGEAVRHPRIGAEIQRAIDEANAAVSRAESIRRFRVLEEDLTEAGGHLTPSLKVRRAKVLADFAADIEALYDT